MNNNPTISVIMTSYNHENYIKEAIESVLSQEKVNMNIIMSDDYSTDSTYKIMNEYAEKYPNIITLISNKKNFGLSKNMQNCITKAKGEYIAFCEGDDYWIDKHKLYKQVDFLSKHADVSLCSSQIQIMDEAQNKFIEHKGQTKHMKAGNAMLSTKDIILSYFVGNLTSIVVRANVVKTFPNKIYKTLVADWFFCILASEEGYIYIMPEKLSAYRIHGNNLWAGKDNEKEFIKLANIYNELTNYRHDKYFKKLISKFYSNKKIIDLKKVVFLILPPIIVMLIVKIKKVFRNLINAK